MDHKALRKLISRLLRHSGFDVKMNKESREYEFFINGNQNPILYCRQVSDVSDSGESETYLCFRVKESLSNEHSKLYDRMVNRFKRLAPEININFENESEPIFTDEQLETLEELCKDFVDNNEGDNPDGE